MHTPRAPGTRARWPFKRGWLLFRRWPPARRRALRPHGERLRRPYAGAAWEREFDGKARTVSNGHAIDAPNLRGHTGVGDWAESQTVPRSALSFGLGVRGYAGERGGVTGNLHMAYAF